MSIELNNSKRNVFKSLAWGPKRGIEVNKIPLCQCESYVHFVIADFPLQSKKKLQGDLPPPNDHFHCFSLIKQNIRADYYA